MSGAVPLPASRPWDEQPGPVARVSGERLVWAWQTKHRPHVQRALLRAGVARCGGRGKTSPGGGALGRCEGRLRSVRPRSPPAACPQGGLSGSATRLLWARVCGCGDPALSIWFACPAGGCVARGWWEAIPGGWPSTVVRGGWCQALSLSRLPVPGGERLGPVARVSRAQVVWAWATQHRPHSVRSCEPALRAVEMAGGHPRGGVPCADVRGV